MQLNEEQLKAAGFAEGICIVIAVPGSGKTLTMTHRIGNLVHQMGQAPESILGLTFTRNAAEAMRQKLVPVLNDLAQRVTLSTIHSFCHYLLRDQGRHFTVLTGKEQIIFMRKVMRKLAINDLSLGMVMREISLSKNNLIDVDEFCDLYQSDSSMEKIADIWRAYDEEKFKKMLLDFDDLLVEASYCQELCMERLGSDPIYFHSIHKFDSSDYFCQAFRMIQPNPSFLSTLA